MELGIESSKSSIGFHESGHGEIRLIHDPFLNNQPTSHEGNDAFTPKSSRSHIESADAPETKATLRRLLKGKEKEWATISASREGPLRLMDLPVDVLRDIIKEVTHTNDLASLALTNSALHRLAIPHIYGRFDIVWPDAHNTAESRTGVDALTYGLATLVMGEEIFGNPQPHMNNKGSGYCQSCMCDRCQSVKSEAATGAKPAKRYRRGNYFARFTKKFSLGNGPPDWVQEYLITKEAGKMLGTLVALSIARMPSLETFIWDMPTGILRDIWISLASLGDRGNPRLERLWIRFHDNRETFTDMGSSHPLTVPQPTQNQLGVTPTASNLQPSQELATTPVATLLGNSYRRTEHPNFSILSPLKSLSVLDVDEPAYLDEISVLIGKSIRTLRELRIGIASTASDSGWASLDSVGVSSEEPDEDNTTSTIGGVLGLMMSKIYNPYVGRPTPSFLPNLELLSPRPVVTDVEAEPESSTIAAEGLLTPTQLLLASHGLSLVSALAESEASLTNNSLTIAELDLAKASLPSSIQTSSSKAAPQCKPADEHRQSSSEQPKNRQNEHLTNQKILPFETLRPRKLQLDVLEMERIVMDVKIIQESINWSIITSLTLLQCGLHEELWRALRTKYGPRPTSISTSPKPASKAKHPQSNPRSDYRLNLKKIHTDTVSPALITFLKETLAPDSLQWMFLQDGRDYKSPVTIETIFRGPLKRHRGSLTKVMIDSAIGKPDSARNSKREKWIFTRELLAFITSGKMTCLKELAMSVEYKDWHFFVQRLPQIPQLRSLYVPYIAHHIYGNHLNPKELALQLVDIIAIRPEIEICYMAFATTCFELLENRNCDGSSWSRFDTSTAPANVGPGGVDDSDDDDANNEGDEDASNPDAPVDPALEDPDDSESDADSSSIGGSDGYTSESERKQPIFKLREILFYDDKVSIFKARHGKL